MNVFIVEDSAVMRENLQAMLSDFSEVKIIGHAADESGAIAQIASTLPDVVILDLNLESGSGINVLKSVKTNHPEIKVIVLTNYTDEHYAEACRRANADYFFDKSFQFMKVHDVLAEWSHAGSAVNRPGGRLSGRQ
ncbi:MAG TPA: response regulator transcription factor [Gallionella sp.]|nr:response regulator transcription factor [Gallionella sp.]